MSSAEERLVLRKLLLSLSAFLPTYLYTYIYNRCYYATADLADRAGKQAKHSYLSAVTTLRKPLQRELVDSAVGGTWRKNC